MYDTIPGVLLHHIRSAVASLGDGGRKLIVTDEGLSCPEDDRSELRDIRVMAPDGAEPSNNECWRVHGALIMLRAVAADERRREACRELTQQAQEHFGAYQPIDEDS